MRSTINKSHFEEVIVTQQSITNDLRDKINSIEGISPEQQNSHDINPEVTVIANEKSEINHSPDSGKKRTN